MGIPLEMRDAWASRRKKNAFFIASPAEEQRIRNARNCTQEGVRAGAKAATIACVATAVPTLAAVRWVPWAKANLNYTAQALIISAGVRILVVSHLPDRVYIAGRYVKPPETFLFSSSISMLANIPLKVPGQVVIAYSQIVRASIAAYFITADKTILECARRNAQYEKSA